MSDTELEKRVRAAVELLGEIHEDRGLLTHLDIELRQEILMAAGRVARPDAKAQKDLSRARKAKTRDRRRRKVEALLDQTQIRRLRENPLFQTPRRRRGPDVAPPPPVGDVDDPRACYVCRARTTAVHGFYDQMCLECGDFNFKKRHQTADLRGRTALLTGGRVKIGYQAGILMLRAGARLIVTTRFPKDAARRYAEEADFADWGDRLEIYGLDLRRSLDVERFCDHLDQTHDRLDHIINNACQTVRRPPGFYDHLMAAELRPDALPDKAAHVLAPAQLSDGSSAEWSQLPLVPDDLLPAETFFPVGRLDADGQQVDLRRINSWRLRLDEVPTVELLEVQLVNSVAPYLLNGRLRGLMTRTDNRDKHIVNVSAMEGQFYRTYKSDRHPHTNMAKAALNMMTRTSAPDYVQDGIHMNSVDTGWVTDEDPVDLAATKREMHRFHPPLDIVDGAARIVDPILHGKNTGEHLWGHFLKDYRVVDW
ncbi:MAG: SDR family oxidoreductase [Proteobacteria bacterium]|nr:SDR family oxidoreductase [Pseudomonadota bacterium]MCP4919799.1 SDR family oxidoreductase [Pseudomonadota bacterium]